MKKIFIVVSCLLLIVSLVGCARTVTNVNFGAAMSVTVTLRGSADVNNNRYFLVLSDSPIFKTPLPLAENASRYEFLEPDGTLPRDTSQALADYYTNFFSTWSGYIMLDNASQYFLVAGPFTQGTAITRTPFAVFAGGTNKLTFTFQLNQLFSAGVPATAYFDVISVPWPSGSYKYASDHLNSTNAYISTLSGSTVTVQDTIDYATPADASLDILTCEATVQ